ncbi:response regulator [uncultured Draconibacterium sp.]|uniref:response regulator n=1 Tax=uncultured Draconibacterium sp. TaxID=1573823 RepID=UPI0032179618
MGKIKILVAEDDQINRKLFSYILKDVSSELLMAADGIEAIKLFNENPDIDLILMDLKMPGMDGYEATEQIRKTNTEVKIIALSAFSVETEQSKAKANGFDAYVSKPVSKVNLIEKIHSYFGV